MRILFLCGSFEPGRDGVGDYTRLLANELISQGHEVAVAAINDRHVEKIPNAPIKKGALSVLRLPHNQNEDNKIMVLKIFIEEFNPDWLSLQFVPFSFHPKGLNFGLAKKLVDLGIGRKWHIMFHELWVGMSEQSDSKERAWKILQHYLIWRTVKILKPSVVHTHTDVYQQYLHKLGAKPRLLPLFANIPVLYPEEIREKLTKENEPSDKIKIVLFGGIHAGAPIKDFAQEAKEYSVAHQREIELIIVGRSGREQQHWINEWDYAGLTLKEMGEQSAEMVSEILWGATYGIFTTPLALVQKSGSVAAMRDHGVHLLCVSKPWKPRRIKVAANPYGIMAYEKGGLTNFFNSKPDFTHLPTLQQVAKQFSADLTEVG